MVDLFDLRFFNKYGEPEFEVGLLDLERVTKPFRIEVKWDSKDSKWILKNKEEANNIYLVENLIGEFNGQLVLKNLYCYLIQPNLSINRGEFPFKYIRCKMGKTDENKFIFSSLKTGEGGDLSESIPKNYFRWHTDSKIWLIKSLNPKKQPFLNWKETPFDQK